MTPRGDGTLVDVFDGDWESVANAISSVDGAESSFTENVTDVIRPSECLAVHQRHLRGRRRDARGRRCRCHCRHRYCHTTMTQSVKHPERRKIYPKKKPCRVIVSPQNHDSVTSYTYPPQPKKMTQRISRWVFSCFCFDSIQAQDDEQQRVTI